MTTDVATKTLQDRVEGRTRCGTVGVRSFDEGIVLTLGAVRASELDPADKRPNYYLPPITGLPCAPGQPGVQVTFWYPEDTYEKYRVPSIVITRDGIDAMMQRWHPGALQYRTAAYGAHPTVADGRSWFDRVEEMPQAVPYDLTYTLLLYTRSRQQGNVLLDHVMRIYPPYCNVKVRDSLGDIRAYSAFAEGIGVLDEVSEVGDRVIGFMYTLRVEGELDLNEPDVQPTVTQSPTLRTKRI